MAEARGTRFVVDDELTPGSFGKPQRRIRHLLVALAPARMTEVHDRAARPQKVLLFERDQAELVPRIGSLLHARNERLARARLVQLWIQPEADDEQRRGD